MDSKISIEPRYPKRKRKEATYVDSDTDESSTDSETECVPVKKRPRKPTKPLPANKIFPFLSLPPEIRNRIYQECLVDHHDAAKGLWLQSQQRNHRRRVCRVAPDTADPQDSHNYRCCHAEKPLVTEAQKPLGVHLLRVCKQIYDEAAPMLYSQRIVFVESSAMVSFLSQLSPRTAKLLKHVEIKLWTSKGTRRSMGYLGLALLAAKEAINIEKIEIKCMMGNHGAWRWRNVSQAHAASKSIARRIYRECYPWFDFAIGHGLGGHETEDPVPSIINMIKIDECNFREVPDYKKDSEEIQRVYRKELRKLIRSGM